MNQVHHFTSNISTGILIISTLQLIGQPIRCWGPKLRWDLLWCWWSWHRCRRIPNSSPPLSKNRWKKNRGSNWGFNKTYKTTYPSVLCFIGLNICCVYGLFLLAKLHGQGTKWTLIRLDTAKSSICSRLKSLTWNSHGFHVDLFVVFFIDEIQGIPTNI